MHVDTLLKRDSKYIYNVTKDVYVKQILYKYRKKQRSFHTNIKRH